MRRNMNRLQGRMYCPASGSNHPNNCLRHKDSTYQTH